MEINLNKIPDKLLFHKYLPDKCKLLYIYLVNTCDKDGVCRGATSKALADKFCTEIRSAQYNLKHLKDAGAIDKVFEDGAWLPKIILNGKGNPVFKENEEGLKGLAPSGDLLRLIGVWDRLYDTNTKPTQEIIKRFNEITEDIPIHDVLKAVRNRYQAIKDDKYWNARGREYFRNSLSHFLKKHETVDTYINMSKQDAKRNETTEFEFI